MNIIIFIYNLLPRKTKYEAIMFLIAIFMMSLLEIAGISGFLPFLSVLSNPDIINTNKYLHHFYTEFGFDNHKSFLFILGVLLLSILLIKILYSLLIKYWQGSFANRIYHIFSVKLFENYLHQNYSFFLTSNSSILLKNVNQEVLKIRNAVINVIDIAVSLLTTTFILVFILTLELWLTIITITFSIIMVFTVSKLTKPKAIKLGHLHRNYMGKIFKHANEGFHGIKDIKWHNKEQYYIEKYSTSLKGLTITNVSYAFLKHSPHYLYQAITFGALFSIVLFFLDTYDSIINILPMLGVFGLAMHRLLPLLSTINVSYMNLKNYMPGIELIKNEIQQNIPEYFNKILQIKYNDVIKFKDVSFQYAGTSKYVIDKVNISIYKGQFIGIIGATGAGKTTILDIFLGLLFPTSGEIKIDNQIISSENINSYKKLVGYIPQSIYLFDDTIWANIAFGVKKEDVDFERVWDVIKIAQLESVINTMPRKLEESVGDAGIRLSGGQRQRLGIARALYNDPEIIFMDEPTSALDGKTETEIHDALNTISGKKTIILVTHQISNLKDCDIIYLLENGRIADQGSYKEIHQRSLFFQNSLKSLTEVDISHSNN